MIPIELQEMKVFQWVYNSPLYSHFPDQLDEMLENVAQIELCETAHSIIEAFNWIKAQESLNLPQDYFFSWHYCVSDSYSGDKIRVPIWDNRHLEWIELEE